MHLLACEHQIAVDVELWQEPLGLMREVKDVSGRGVGPFVPVGQSVAEVERLLEYCQESVSGVPRVEASTLEQLCEQQQQHQDSGDTTSSPTTTSSLPYEYVCFCVYVFG
jgi:hypothetical protein